MENGVKALMMGFAIIVFIIGITIAFRTLSQAKSTADIVFYHSDRENFQELKHYNPELYQNGARIVNRDTVIATMYRCIREKFSLEIELKNLNEPIILEYDTTSKEEIQNIIKNFVKNVTADEFIETYVEVKTMGKTYFGNDGTSLEENVGKKLYIKYEEKVE